MTADAVIIVFGASGLIGEAVVRALMAAGFAVRPVARRFTRAQHHAFGATAIETGFMALDAAGLRTLGGGPVADIVVNCVGVLQDSARGATQDVHQDFTARLLAAFAGGGTLLVQISIPGDAGTDRTAYSLTKRAAERMITGGTAPYVILRPGFVLAPAAYGGSALLRALAMLPVALPAREAAAPFAVTAIGDVTATIADLARRWQAGAREWAAAWDVMAVETTTVGEVVERLRAHLGGPAPIVAAPAWLMAMGAWAGDLVSLLGWSPAVRGTALLEMRRGVAGDPSAWITATGLRPAGLNGALAALPATVQESWFARLFLLKPLMLGGLVVFWVVSGLIALTVAFRPASAILRGHGFSAAAADIVTVVSSLVDISVGLAIAWRRTCRVGLLAGVAVSLGYMAGAAVLTPEIWIEPLGALVKTGPAIVLMLCALAMLEER
jgi:uncharacterized protein YbjT (DUF2867 family)